MNNNFIKISGANSSQKNIQYKNNKKNLKMIISKTSSNRKNISSTSRGALNLNNIEILPMMIILIIIIKVIIIIIKQIIKSQQQ